MTTIALSNGCKEWKNGDVTLHPPVDRQFLEAITQAGFVAFTGPAGMCGAKSELRSVVLIHRGRGTRWEVCFREHEADVVTTTTTDLEKTTPTIVSWLLGQALLAAENSIQALAG